jgi:hypothetical protein
MAKAQAESKAAEMKAASKKIAKAGVTRHKHVPQTEGTAVEGVDTVTEAVVESGFPSTNVPGDSDMTKTQDVAQASEQAAESAVALVMNAQAAAQAERERVAKAKIEAKMKKNEEAKAKKEAADKARADAKAARDAKVAENAEAKATRIAELAATGKTYTGSMLALAERVKAGAYVKSMTGQLRSTDELAEALDAVPAENVVKMGMAIFAEPNKYATLNIGQQSMNYRNRLRGAIKNGAEVGGVKITLDLVKEVRDANNFATGEQMAAERKEKAEARAKAKADKEVADKAKADAAAKAKADKAAEPVAA